MSRGQPAPSRYPDRGGRDGDHEGRADRGALAATGWSRLAGQLGERSVHHLPFDDGVLDTR